MRSISWSVQHLKPPSREVASSIVSWRRPDSPSSGSSLTTSSSFHVPTLYQQCKQGVTRTWTFQSGHTKAGTIRQYRNINPPPQFTWFLLHVQEIMHLDGFVWWTSSSKLSPSWEQTWHSRHAKRRHTGGDRGHDTKLVETSTIWWSVCV